MVSAVDLSYWLYIALRFWPWMELICLLVLLAAAFLYWRHTRHWCLLALTIGSFLAALGMIAQEIGKMLFHGHIATLIASGSVQSGQNLAAIGWWAVFCGVVVGIAGGIGAIHWAIRLRRQRE